MLNTVATEALAEAFRKAAAENRAVLFPYLTAGLPDVAGSVKLFQAMSDAGADGFEVGIPYSDPLMDGPTIQEAGERALAAGATMDTGLEVVRQVVESTGKPVLVMTYVNPVLRMGVTRFMERIAQAGASGVIVADLPVDEADPFLSAADAFGIGVVLFAAPTIDEARLRLVAESKPLFIYGVAELGVTGERVDRSTHAPELARRVRAATDIPLVMGVGISTPAHASAAAEVADGVIVGSAIVRCVLDAADQAAAEASVARLVTELAAAVRR
ncbi:MAG: tryptophan synthase subunit alpha [Acidimicrobiia bacterium]|nr:tryptophan synthase subunit alpha [Acidimicrobiia bacterium]